MSYARFMLALGLVAMIGCPNTETDSVQNVQQPSIDPATAQSAASLTVHETMIKDEASPWRTDPLLAGRFRPDYPNDVQVIVHDGGPRFTETPPELVWGTATGKQGNPYRGNILNQPKGVQSVKEGEEILFLVVADSQYPFQTSERYLAERPDWVIKPCNKCGFAELFDAPSDLITKIFPNVGKNPDEEIEVFTSFCPMCRGIQVIHKPGVDVD